MNWTVQQMQFGGDAFFVKCCANTAMKSKQNYFGHYESILVALMPPKLLKVKQFTLLTYRKILLHHTRPVKL